MASQRHDGQYHWRYVPFGYELITTSTEVRLYGEFSLDLADALHNANGYWDPHLLAYVMPHGRAAQIDLALRKYMQESQSLEQTMAMLAERSGALTHAAPQSTQGNVSEPKVHFSPTHIDRVTSPAAGGKATPSTINGKVSTPPDRKKVVVGQYQIGDLLSGKPIEDFGRKWLEYPNLDWQFARKGSCTLCHQLRGLDTHGVCRPCAADQANVVSVPYCYAYFNEKQ